MSTNETIPSLMFFTLGAVLLVVAVLAISFFRKRRNRHPMAGVPERNIDEIERGEPPRRDR